MLAAVVVAAVLTTSSSSTPVLIASASSSPAAGACALATPAFCDTFDQAAGTGNRSGQLDGTLWGVSRVRGGGFNSGQGQFDNWVAPTTMAGTCPSQSVSADNDIQICNGRLNDAVNDNLTLNASNQTVANDNGDVTSLAMYPKQPFDFAGRTGKITFDVSDDSGGTHAAWPELWVTDQPVPDPFVHFSSWQSIPRNGVGIRLDAACTPGQGPNCAPNCPANNAGYVVSVASAITVTNYGVNDSDLGDIGSQNAGTLQVVADNCVVEPTGPGQLNHFEVDMSQGQIDVYGTNAFAGSLNLANTPLVHLASIPNANLGLTRGLVWLEDDHYNANKQVNPKLQGMHTFTWDNVGFDGPVLPRDLVFDALDSGQHLSNYPTTENLGWYNFGFGNPNSVTVTVPGVNSIAAGSGGLLTFNAYTTVAPVNFTWSLNGNPVHSYPWPFADSIGGSPRTIAIPIALSELVAGTNIVTITNNDTGGLFLNNVDLVLQGAGGSGGTTATTPTSVPFGSPTAGISSVEVANSAGYFITDSLGQVRARGSAVWRGDLSGLRLNAPIIAIEATPDGGGYWLLGADGGIFTFGDAPFFGSTGNLKLNAPVVGMAATPDNGGYWVIAKDGGVFTFGDAAFHGSTGNIRLNQPVDGIAVAPGANGYWLVAGDGGVLTFTSDGFYGSLGNVSLNKPIVGMSSTPTGRGYTLVAADGGVFTFGDAPFYGSLGNNPPASPIVGISPAPANTGYYLVTSSGAVYTFGPGAQYEGGA